MLVTAAVNDEVRVTADVDVADCVAAAVCELDSAGDDV